MLRVGCLCVRYKIDTLIHIICLDVAQVFYIHRYMPYSWFTLIQHNYTHITLHQWHKSEEIPEKGTDRIFDSYVDVTTSHHILPHHCLFILRSVSFSLIKRETFSKKKKIKERRKCFSLPYLADGLKKNPL